MSGLRSTPIAALPKLARGPTLASLWRLALVHFLVSRDLERALYLLELAFSLGREGAVLNEPEALMWRSNAYFHAGDLGRADADADRLLEIGRSMSLTPANVRVIRHRAMGHLRTCMDGGQPS